VALIQELRRHGYELSPGTLYPILHNLEEAGYLVREERIIGGKVRKYYSLTEAGGQALAEAKGKIREVVDEVLEGHGPASPSLPDDAGEIEPGIDPMSSVRA
jgi:PadR family transcriptional regulator, regulatory protein PadR